MKKVVVSWSGGKDSCFACYKALELGYQPFCLLNTVSQEYKRVRFHGVQDTLIQQQAHAIGVPLLQIPTTQKGYTEEFSNALASMKQKGIRGAVFGDIFPYMNQWAEEVCKKIGIEAIEPLCGRDSKDILSDFINSGFEAIVVATQANRLDKEWIGRKLDNSFLQDIQRVPGVDPCGEKGEYHTLVVDGPLFKQKIEIQRTEKILRDNYWFLDIQDYKVAKK